MASNREDIYHDSPPVPLDLAVDKGLSLFEKIYNIGFVRKTFIVLLISIAWQFYATYVDSPFLFPSLAATITAFYNGIVRGELIESAARSMKILIIAYASGMLCAAAFTFIATLSRFGSDLLETLTAMFNPLPSIALLPLSLLWFGIGLGSLVFVIVHSVLWAVALNTHMGFRSVSKTLQMVGKNYGMGPAKLAVKILIPAAFPSILSGLKIGWAFAWRTLIASELVFGITSGGAGLGWFIYQSKNELEIASVFAGLLMIILIGLFVENVIFKTIEARTIRRWGMNF
jgi:NitT/TauT family transport system permease protein